MRKLILILLATVLILPAAARAGRDSPGDGSLVVSSADGKFAVQGKGLIFGHLDHGTITIVEYKPDANTALSSVSGAALKLLGGNVVYSGSDVRFLFPSGKYNLILEGSGIDISAVGSGRLRASGAGTGDDGSVTADSSHAQPIGTSGTVTYGRGNSSGAGNAGTTRGNKNG